MRLSLIVPTIGALLFLCPASGQSPEEAMAQIHPEAIRAHMTFLADDLLEGRGYGDSWPRLGCQVHRN